MKVRERNTVISLASCSTAQTTWGTRRRRQWCKRTHLGQCLRGEQLDLCEGEEAGGGVAAEIHSGRAQTKKEPLTLLLRVVVLKSRRAGGLSKHECYKKSRFQKSIAIIRSWRWQDKGYPNKSNNMYLSEVLQHVKLQVGTSVAFGDTHTHTHKHE